jgi:hypothetical protein
MLPPPSHPPTHEYLREHTALFHPLNGGLGIYISANALRKTNDSNTKTQTHNDKRHFEEHKTALKNYITAVSFHVPSSSFSTFRHLPVSRRLSVDVRQLLTWFAVFNNSTSVTTVVAIRHYTLHNASNCKRR